MPPHAARPRNRLALAVGMSLGRADPARRARSRRRLRPRPARALSELAGPRSRRRRSRRGGARCAQGNRRGRDSRCGHRGGALAFCARRIRRRGGDLFSTSTPLSGSGGCIASRRRADLRNLCLGQRALRPTEQSGVPIAARRVAPQPETLGRGCVRAGADFRAEAGGDSARLRRARRQEFGAARCRRAAIRQPGDCARMRRSNERRSPMLSGSMVAIVTPMQDDGRLDFERFKSLIDFHIEQGTDGIFVVGTTGESPTVDFDEHKELIRLAIAHARGRVPIVAGTGGNSTAEAIELTQSAKNAGADACLSVVPYYNKPTQEGLYRHFRAIAETVDIPQIVYNVPGRTVADLANETTLRLAQVPNIVGIKDATASIERGSDLLHRAPKNFTIYSGDDATCLALILLGGKGVISVTANVAPRLMHEMGSAALAGDLKKARELNFKLLGLHTKLFVEANPIPVKWAVAQMGLIGMGIRLPLTPLSQAFHEVVREAMRQADVMPSSGLRVVEGKAG